MDNAELGRLSPEQLQKLAGVIAEAKSLTSQQEEIIEKVLSGEEDIGKLRIAYLNEYFDSYSRNLDLIARKCSRLHDTFLVLDEHAQKSLEAFKDSREKKPPKTDKTKKPDSTPLKDNSSAKDTTGGASNKPSGKSAAEKTLLAAAKDIKEILKTLKTLKQTSDTATPFEVTINLNQETSTTGSKATEVNNLNATTTSLQDTINKYSTLTPVTTPGMSVSVPQDDKTGIAIEELLKETKKTNTYTTAQEILSELQGGFKNIRPLHSYSTPGEGTDADVTGEHGRDIPAGTPPIAPDISTSTPAITTTETTALPESVDVTVRTLVSEESLKALRAETLDQILDKIDRVKLQEVEIAAQREINAKRHVSRLLSAAEETHTALLSLEIARTRTEEELETKRVEFRLSKIKEVVDAELASQHLMDELNTQLDYAKNAAGRKELGQLRAEHAAAVEQLKSLEELKAKMAERRQALEFEAMAKNHGKLLARDAAAIEKQLSKEFSTKKKQLDELTAERFEKEKQIRELAELKKLNPNIALAIEKDLANRRAELEYEARSRNNGILLAEEAQNIEKQLREEYQLKEDLLKKFAEKSIIQDRLDLLKQYESELASTIEQQMADMRAELEAEARATNSGRLSAEDSERIEAQIQAKFPLTEDQINELAATQQVEKSFRDQIPYGSQLLDATKAKEIVQEESKLRKELGRELTEEERKNIKKQAEEKYKLDEKNKKKLIALQNKADEEARKADIEATDRKIESAMKLGELSKEDNLLSRMKTLKSIVDSAPEGQESKAALAVALKAISSLMAQLESKIDSIASYQGDIDTRLQGSDNKQSSGSYWKQLTKDMMSVGAVTPFFKQEDFANNIKELVNKGISFDLKQRAFLMTIQEKIANTFNVADGTLLRLIRIQQEDSTAGRLGMESALNSFLNEMYETSEYLSDVAASVRSSLEEMESLMGGAAATEVEYQVQKWMGSLYSVGMSQSAVTNIANALGQIASGQVDALTNGGTGNLLVMAANDAGLSIAEILTEGLDAQNTNKLLQATVNYLAEIAASSKNNNVVQQQLANVFGVKASDLRAATNLTSTGTTNDIFGSIKTYDNLLKQLNDMAGSMASRTSLGEMMTNIWENGQYTLASSMANNPVAYLLYKMAGLLEDTTGGISLPFLNVMGFGVDLETTVADLMRVASMSAGVLGSIGPMISGLASSFSGRAMLSTMGIGSGSGLAVTPRGGDGVGGGGGAGGGGLTGGGAATTSGSGFVGNSSGSDIQQSTMQEANDSKKQQMIEAKEEAETNQVDILNSYVIKIYSLLDEVAHGNRSLNVKVAGYGLIGTNSSGAQGGVNGLNNANSNTNNAFNNGTSNSGISGNGGSTGGWSDNGYSSGSNGGTDNFGGSTSGGSVNSGNSAGASTSVNLGGWTMM